MVLSRRTTTLGTENAFSILHDIDVCRSRGMDVVELNLGEPDFDTPKHVGDVAVSEIRAGNTHYCPPAGIRPLREAIAKHISSSRGIEVEPDLVVVTPGAKPTIGYAFHAYVEPGDEVIYPSPGFPIYESWAAFMGATPVPIQLSDAEGFTLSGDDLAGALTDRTKLVILNSPSNPTGGAFSESQLAEVASMIADRATPELRVYSDEIYEHLLFDGEEHRSIATLEGMRRRTVIVSGHSKSFSMTGWRLGFAVLPTLEEARFFEQLNINVFSCVAPFIQEAGRAALEDPRSAAAVKSMVQELQSRRDWVVEALNRIEGISCQLPKGAFYAFPNVEGACKRLGAFEAHESLTPSVGALWTPSRLLQMFLLYQHGVATIDRDSFGRIGAEGQHYLRLSFATGMDRLREGIDRIDRACSDRDGFARFLDELGLDG